MIIPPNAAGAARKDDFGKRSYKKCCPGENCSRECPAFLFSGNYLFRWECWEMIHLTSIVVKSGEMVLSISFGRVFFIMNNDDKCLMFGESPPPPKSLVDSHHLYSFLKALPGSLDDHSQELIQSYLFHERICVIDETLCKVCFVHQHVFKLEIRMNIFGKNSYLSQG